MDAFPLHCVYYSTKGTSDPNELLSICADAVSVPPTSSGDVPYPHVQEALKFQSSGSSLRLESGGKDVQMKSVKQENQNADEEGVFISDAALDKKKQDEAGHKVPAVDRQNAGVSLLVQ